MQKHTHSMRSMVLFANLLFSFAGAITLYANSSFLEETVGIGLVGVLYALSAVLSIVFLSKAGRTLAHIGNRNFFFLYAAIYSISLMGIILPIGTGPRVMAFIVYLIATNMLIFSLNVFFEHLFTQKNKGKVRGTFLLLGNTGIMLGPLFAARAIDMFGYGGMYALSLGFFALLAFVMYPGLRHYSDAKYNFGRLTTAIRHTIKTRTLRNVIAANFILQFFYAWMIVYTPIYLIQHVGLSWDSVGIIFSLMLLTFVVLDYPLGKIADWLGSEKELAAIGFLLMTASTFALAIVDVPSMFQIGAILVLSRIGAATVEAMTEIHFFKVAKDSDPGLLSLFCDLRPLSYVIAPLIGALALAFLPFKMIFVVLSLILMIGFVVSFYLESTTEWWVPAHKK